MSSSTGSSTGRMHECIGGYDNGKLTVFHHSGMSQYCRDLWHIGENHMPPQEEITRQVWEDFQTCVAHTLIIARVHQQNKQAWDIP